MRAIRMIALTAWMALLAAPLQAEDLIPWVRDLQTAQEIASRENRLVLIHFYADDCPPCQRLEQNVFPRPDVARAISKNYIPVKVHGQRRTDIARRYGVDRWPTDVIITPAGHKLSSSVSPQDPNKYISLVNQIADSSRSRALVPGVAVRDGGRSSAAQNSQVTPTGYEQRASSGGSNFGPLGPQANASGPPSSQSRYAPAGNQPASIPAAQGSRYGAAPATAPTGPQPNPYATDANGIPTSPLNNPQQPQGPISRYGAIPSAAQPANASRYSNGSIANQPSMVSNPAAGPAPRGLQNPAYGAPESRYGQSSAPNPPIAGNYGQNASRYGQANAPAGLNGGAQQPGNYQPAGYGQPAEYGPSPNNFSNPAYNTPAPSQPVQNQFVGPAPPQSPPQVQSPPQQQLSAQPQAQPAPPQAQPSQPQVQPPAAAPQHPPIAMDGFCPVTLSEKQKWAKGDPKWGAIHQGRTYLFTGAEEQKRFLAQPDVYSPALSGYDAVRFTETGQLVEGVRNHGVFYKSQIFLFADEGALERFWRQPTAYVNRVEQARRQAEAGGQYR